MKKYNYLKFLLIILVLIFMTGCGTVPSTTYTVTFDSQGGSTVSSQTVEDGGLVTEPTAPTKEGETFTGWYKESGCTNAWDFGTDAVTANITLYAKWGINTHTVTFDSQGGSTVSSQTVEESGLVTEPTAPTKEGYTFSGWYKESGCTSAWDFATDTVTANVTLYVKWTPYALGDTGPAGGYIFYDKGYYSKADFRIVKATGNGTVPITPPYDAWRYLEAAPSDQSYAPWGCHGISISGADGTEVSTGEQNTIDIEAGCTTPDTAADICVNLSLGGYSDWFLPSKDELNLMYENLKLHGVGDFAGTNYWSSSEFDASHAWFQYFYDGNQQLNYKINPLRVRAVRAF